MTIYRFHDEVWVPRPPRDVFPFFAEARNLDLITPPWLGFEILTPGPIAMKVGAIIDYRLRVHGIPLRWRTGITVWEPIKRFVDEQLRGPYRLWRHTHTFTERFGGTVCADDIEYAVPGGFLVHRMFVRRDVTRIFAYRRDAVLRIFGGARASSHGAAGS